MGQANDKAKTLTDTFATIRLPQLFVLMDRIVPSGEKGRNTEALFRALSAKTTRSLEKNKTTRV